MTIFKRIRLRPSQLRTVADRRFDDAQALRGTGENARANGAMYLGGFVVECLLKAKLMERFPWLQGARSPQGRTKADQHLWSLCYRSHDLDEILAKLPDVIDKLSQVEGRESNRLIQSLTVRRSAGNGRFSPAIHPMLRILTMRGYFSSRSGS